MHHNSPWSHLEDDDDDEDESTSSDESPVKPKKMFDTPADDRISTKRARGKTIKFTAGAAGSEKSVDKPKQPRVGSKTRSRAAPRVVTTESPGGKRMRTQLQESKDSQSKKEKQNKELQKKLDGLNTKLANLERESGANAKITEMSQVVERLELLHTATRQLVMAMTKDSQALGTMLNNLRTGFKLK